MIRAATGQGRLHLERAPLKCFTSIKCAGADVIFSCFAGDSAR